MGSIESKGFFNPADPKYKKVEDLPVEEKENFVDVNGGFVKKKAQDGAALAKIAAKLTQSDIEGIYIKDAQDYDKFREKASAHLDDFDKIKERSRKTGDWKSIPGNELRSEINFDKILGEAGVSEEELFADKQLAIKYVSNYPSTFINGAIRFMQMRERGNASEGKSDLEKLFKDKDFVLAMLESDHLNTIKHGFFDLISKEVLSDKQVVTALIKKEPYLLDKKQMQRISGMEISDELRSDPEVVLAVLESKIKITKEDLFEMIDDLPFLRTQIETLMGKA